MDQKRKYLPQTILQAKAENDIARRVIDGRCFLCISIILHKTTSNRNRAQSIHITSTKAAIERKPKSNYSVSKADRILVGIRVDNIRILLIIRHL